MQHENMEHSVMITNREVVVVEGVVSVEKFDEQEIVLETDMGVMAIRGEELHVEQLSLERGHLTVKGLVRSVDYIEDGGRMMRRKGFMERLFR